MSTSLTTIVRVRQLAAEGHNSRYIAEALNREQHPSPSGYPGTKWHHETVRRLARRNRIQVGEMAR